MNRCYYCGREIEQGQGTCSGCGRDLRAFEAEVSSGGVLDPITPCRRCRCGEVMRYFTPTPGESTFFRPYGYRYRCRRCGREAIVPPWDKRPQLIFGGVLGVGAVLWLCFSKTAAEFDRSSWNTRWVVIAIMAAVVGLAAGHLALLGAWNRWRYPVVDWPADDADPPESST